MKISTKIIRNTSFLGISFVGQKLLAFVYFVIIARVIGVENVGVYTYALSFTTIFAIFIDLGTSPAVTREIAKDETKVQSYFTNIIFVKFLLSVLVYITVIVIINLLGKPQLTKNLIYVSGIVMFLDSFTLTIYSILRGIQRLKYEAIGVILNQSIVITIGTIGLVLITKDIIILMFAFLIGSLANLSFALYILKTRYNIIFNFSPDIEKIKAFYKLSVPFGIAGIFTRIYSYVDVLLIEFFIGYSFVGWYSVAYKIPFALQFIPNVLSAAIYPAMSSLHTTSKEKLAVVWEKSTKYLLILTLPMSFGIYSLADAVILRFYGDQYSMSISILKVLIFGLFFIFLNFPLGALLNACNKQTANTVLIGCTMVINIIANVIFIPIFGVIGAAFAFLLSHGFLFFSSLVIAQKIININFKDFLYSFLKVFICSAIMAVLVIFLRTKVNWLLTIPAGALIYGALIIFTKIISLNEIKELTGKFFK